MKTSMKSRVWLTATEQKRWIAVNNRAKSVAPAKKVDRDFEPDVDGRISRPYRK